jgi:hypothetical protein
MIKYLVAIFSIIIIFSTTSCRTTKHINKAIAKKDTATINLNKSVEDSLKEVNAVVDKFKSHHIDFKTFNAKIKVEYEDNKGKQPDVTATVRIMRDSAIWVSLSATILNIEVYRILITRDSVILVQYRSLDYLQEITGIPFDYYTLQDLLIGNPIFMDGKIVAYKKTESAILLSSVGKYFKHLITLSTDKELLQHSKLDDVDFARNRTADITYSDYENKNGIDFSTYREITVSEKNKLDIRLNYKSYEFNKDLSVSFSIPKNYKRN